MRLNVGMIQAILITLASLQVVVAFLPIQTPSQQPTCLFAVAQGRGRRQQQQQRAPKPVMNDEITFPNVRVMAPNPLGKDEPLGIMSISEARSKAAELGGLDVILVNANSDPPVCKIVDYSKYRYMQEKKAKEVKKNSKASELKEVKMSYKIDVHDYGVRKKNALKFLRQGNRVKCTIMFRGREMQHNNLGADLLQRLATELEDTAVKEGGPRREGRQLFLILSPRPEVMREVSAERRAMEKAKKKNKFAADEAPQNGAQTKGSAATADKSTAQEEAKSSKADQTLDKLLGGDGFF